MQRQTSLYLIVVGVFMLLISGSFLSEGVSHAGMDNAIVSQRMAEGFEDFWMPSLSSPGNPDRQNYLPLGYWLESKWYALFGDNSFMAEKVYSVMTYFILAALIIWIWTLIGHSRRTGWLPLLCWITIPIVSWSATNNLLESTMTMFILLSVAFMIKGYKALHILKARKTVAKGAGRYQMSRMAWVFLSAVMMELAFLVKGFSGLFPVFIPFLYWLMVRRERIIVPIVTTSLILIVWMTTIFVVIFVSPDIYSHLYNYLHHQMIGGVLHVRTVESRFYILYVLILQSIIPIVIMMALFVLRLKSRPFYRHLFFWRNRGKLTADQINRSKIGWFFFVLGLSGLLPIMIGLKQQEFYIVPTLPFFAIAMSCIMYDMIEDWLENMNKVAQYVLGGLAIVIFSSGLLLNISSIHKVNSNHVLISDMKIILPYLDKGETICVSHEVMESSEIAEFFYRYKQINFDTVPDKDHLMTLFSQTKEYQKNTDYVKMDLPTSLYSLYTFVEKEPVMDTMSIMCADTTVINETDEI
ncbi:MAG: phospholipid carrier-dependent glycosyltransferase [Bacteroidales bacterium]|nr:phospholipid carrier-dependent glycosyltransferase [Bacteroidales bacterium]